MLQVLLVEKKLSDVHVVLGQASTAIEQWPAPSVHQKESLKVFFLVLQVCHYLMCGQVCTHSSLVTTGTRYTSFAR